MATATTSVDLERGSTYKFSTIVVFNLTVLHTHMTLIGIVNYSLLNDSVAKVEIAEIGSRLDSTHELRNKDWLVAEYYIFEKLTVDNKTEQIVIPKDLIDPDSVIVLDIITASIRVTVENIPKLSEVYSLLSDNNIQYEKL